MRGLPNVVVVSPADDIETAQATWAIADWPGPVYLRLGRYPVPRLFDKGYQFEIGRATMLRQGSDVTIFATGHMSWKAMEAAELLAQNRIEAKVVNVSTIKPLDEAAIQDAAGKTSLLVSVEEHSIIGGLGGAIAEYLSGMALSVGTTPPPLLRLGVRDEFGESALADELLEKHRLTGALIAEMHFLPQPAFLVHRSLVHHGRIAAKITFRHGHAPVRSSFDPIPKTGGRPAISGRSRTQPSPDRRAM